MLWKKCMPAEFYKYVCLEESFVYLNRKKCALFETVRNNLEIYTKI